MEIDLIISNSKYDVKWTT